MLSSTNFYLDQINPLQDLDLPSVINMIQLGRRGYYARLQWLYRALEAHDPVVRAVKRRLLASLSGLDWNIKQAPMEDDDPQKALADKQAQSLRDAYDAITNLRSALTFLALADLRGFSHLEKIYAGSLTTDFTDGTDQRNPSLNSQLSTLNSTDPWQVVELRIVEQWFWIRDGYYGAWQYNPGARDLNVNGVPINPRDFVIHSIDDPSDEIFARLVVKRGVNDADWDGYLADYGVLPMFIVGPPNVPTDREAIYQTTAENAVSRKRGYLPNGASLASPSVTGAGGAGIFAERLHYLDEQIVIAGTAGKLTVLSEAGSGTLAGTAQKEAFDEIAQAIANQVATKMHEQFDKPLLARLHPGEPVLAYFEFAQINVKDTSAILTDAATAATAGYMVDEEELSEKSGYKLSYVGTPQPGGTPAVASSDGTAPVPPKEKPPVEAAPTGGAPDPEQINQLQAKGNDAIAQADSADLVPLRRALESVITNPTPETLQQLLAQLPQLQDELGTSNEDARANALGTALVTGLTS